ncbi:hypothetical protein MSPP1_003521 [Malassezia sp. CBS 17886]|nr:hypothetical protein MSPP1_003521 [Malassezia sp. CBS 17886]
MGLRPHRITRPLAPDATSRTHGVAELPLECDGQRVELPRRAFFDLVVIGSGPASLSLVSRILEARPAALYLEDERQHLHWLNRNQTNAASAPTIRTHRHRAGSVAVRHRGSSGVAPASTRLLSILVIDRLADGWLAHFNGNFNALEIPFLRSPMFFHPDPSDLDGLLAFAVRNDRATAGPPSVIYEGGTTRRGHAALRRKKDLDADPEMLEIPGVVGKEVSKHKRKQAQARAFAQLHAAHGPTVNERDRKDYHTPGTPLFQDFVRHTVERYKLEPSRGADGKVTSLAAWLNTDEAESKSDGHTMARSALGGVTSRTFAKLVRGDVVDMDYGRLCVGGDEADAFLLRTADGTHIGAKYVVSAIGNGQRPMVPAWLPYAERASQKEESPDVEAASLGAGGLMDAPAGRDCRCRADGEERAADGEDAASLPHSVLPPTHQPSGDAILPGTSPGTTASCPSLCASSSTDDAASCADSAESCTDDTSRDDFCSTPGRPDLLRTNLARPVLWTDTPEKSGVGWAHSAALCTPGFTFPPAELQAEMDRGAHRTLVVIGGGLSSAQICHLALRRGFTKVVLLLRGHLKVKAFDFSIDWVGKYSNLCKMQFWQCDEAAERAKMIRQSREGGSMNVPWSKLLLRYAREGRVEIRTHTEVEAAAWAGTHWRLRLQRQDGVPQDSHYMNNTQRPGTLAEIDADYVVASTGSQLGFRHMPFMRTLAHRTDIQEVDGLPVLSEDLQYGGLPLFCVGPYAALQTGPAGFNMGGMRDAADRVAARLHELVRADRAETVCAEEAHSAERPRAPCWQSSYTHFAFDQLQVEEARA